jgi:hypothetical protein
VSTLVGEGGAADEQRGGAADEEVGPLLLTRVQARRDERPQLVEPDRAGADQREEKRDLDAEEEPVEDAGHDQLVAHHVAPRLPVDDRRAERTGDEVPGLVGEDQRDDHGDNDHRERLDQAVAQFAQVVHQGHSPVRVVPSLGAHVALAHDAGTPDGRRL